MQVRPATSADTDSLLRLTEEMDRFYGAVDVGSFEVRRRQLYDALFGDIASAHALVALDQFESIIGFASYSFLWPAVGLSRSIYLKELFVSGTVRRRGIGSALMERLSEIARRHDCSRIEWTTDSDNAVARRFYDSVGMGEHPHKLFFRRSL